MFLHASAATLAASLSAKDFMQNGSGEDSALADLQRKPDCTHLSRNLKLLRLRGPNPCWPQASNPTMPLPPQADANQSGTIPVSGIAMTRRQSASSEDSALADLQREPEVRESARTLKEDLKEVGLQRGLSSS